MKEIFFSIVIPAYNASESIITTLDCVKAQSYQNFEVTIVDDKSADAAKLAEVVNSERYSALKINLVLSDVKLNGAGARNRGIDLSTGDYVCFLDADDEWHQDKLKDTLTRIEELTAQGKDRFVIYSQVNIIEDGSFLKVMPLIPPARDESIAEYLFGCYGFIQTSTIVLKREHAAEIRFDERFIRHQDYDFCIRADKSGFEFNLIAKPLASYHMVTTFNSSHKGESVKYSTFWLQSMSPYLSKRDVYTYKAYKLPIRYKMDGKVLQASLSFAQYFLLTNKGNRNYFIGRVKQKLSERVSKK
ncbi:MULTISPECIES: glycosyltransferase family 2 protein [Erwinia]|uniref:glycosyltransferase family 2 protein n=1 Tax=Erwinia TaxID=551 RepID=UPI0005510048|nr:MULTISPECIES: glycosyltransferase family 2 protein [Erwinia]